jgi:beta-lactamase superfamily II metal-dependent hydrolase
MPRAWKALVLLAAAPLPAQVEGQPLPPWSPGQLDIHRISTGKGDAVFYILPDGTTLLVDPGATSREGPRVTEQRPDSSHTPGGWVLRYLRHVWPPGAGQTLDYALLTHFHGDHMGDVRPDSKKSEAAPYRLSGITEVLDALPARTLIDRDWPAYDYPAPLKDRMMENYRAFLEFQRTRHGMRVERFQPGRKDQVVLRREAERYPSFEVRNVASNGEIWTGVGVETRRHFPALDGVPARDRPSENMCSIAFRMSYGKFDYYAGGDITGLPDEGAPLWHDVETPVAQAVGPVDVAVLNHHGYIDTENAFFVSALRPRVHIFSVWSPGQPGPRVLRRLLSDRLYPGPRDIFATNMADANSIVVADISKLKSKHGHIVVRVEPGGGSYRVIILDDTAETYRVTAVHGPYESR